MNDTSKQYDVSPQEYRNVQDRARLRATMRAEFLKQCQNPHRLAVVDSGYAFDPVLQRWLSMRAQHWHYFKPNPKTFIYPAFVAFTVITYGILLDHDKKKKELMFRTGQVSSHDRKNRFV